MPSLQSLSRSQTCEHRNPAKKQHDKRTTAQANRANSHASTGPKTRKGKIRPAQNARRHGFSVSILATRCFVRRQRPSLTPWRAIGRVQLYLRRRVVKPRRKFTSFASGDARHDLFVRNLKKLKMRSSLTSQTNTPFWTATSGAPFRAASLPFAN